MESKSIPPWLAYAIEPEDASVMFRVPVTFIRLAGLLTKKGQYDLPCHWVGNRLKIHRVKMEHWMDEHEGEDFKTSLLMKRAREYEAPRRGRPRKER